MSQWGRVVVKELGFFRRWHSYVLAIVIIVIPITMGIINAGSGVFRDDFDVFSKIMITPIGIVLPILVVVLSCLSLFTEIGHRHLANTRNRIDVHTYMSAKLFSAVIISFGTFFLLSAAAVAVAFYIWPLLGNPSIDPSVYEMSASEAAADSLERTSYSSLLSFGPFAYGLFYSLWLGLGAASYASLGIASLLLIQNRVLALSAPFLLYFGQTIVVSLLGAPQLSLLYSLLPFGLKQAPLLEAGAPTIVVILGSLILWRVLFRKLKSLDRLA